MPLDFVHPKLSIHEEEAKDEESFHPIIQTPKNSDKEGNDDASLGLNVGGKEGHDSEDDDEELYRDVNINLEGIDSLFETTPRVDVQASPLTLIAPTLPPLTIPTISQFAGAISSILGIVERYMDQRMNEAVKVVDQIQFDRLRDEAQAKNEEFLNNLDENMQKIIKEQVKEQLKVQVSKILPKIKKTMNEQLEAGVLTRSSNASKTSYVVAADLSEMELKKILIEKMESKNILNGFNNKRNLQLLIVLGTRLYQLLTKAFNRDLAMQAESCSSFNELMDTPVDFSTFLMNRLKVDTLTPKLLAGPTYELMKGSCKSLVELEFFLEEVYKTTTDQLDCFTDLPSTRSMLEIDDEKVYKFKEGDFKRLHIQDIKDMLLLLVQGKLKNLTVEEHFAFNVSLRMFTRSIVIQRRVEDLQLGVKSYQKKLNFTKPDTYHSDLKCKEAYTAYSNLIGFIYHNKDKQNRLMWIDELHKFSNGTLNDVRTALDDYLKGIRMNYLPQAIQRKSDKERAAVMI
nr:hypothetical protein [Tanacetum cinerariifolium]